MNRLHISMSFRSWSFLPRRKIMITLIRATPNSLIGKGQVPGTIGKMLCMYMIYLCGEWENLFISAQIQNLNCKSLLKSSEVHTTTSRFRINPGKIFSLQHWSISQLFYLYNSIICRARSSSTCSVVLSIPAG